MLTTILAPNTLLLNFNAKWTYNHKTKKFKIILITSNPHGLVGQIKISLANFQTIKAEIGNTIANSDIINQTFLFNIVNLNTLETEFEITDYNTIKNINWQDTFDGREIELKNNGTPYTATIQNNIIKLSAGKYIFTLIDGSVFDGAKFEVQEIIEGDLRGKKAELYEQNGTGETAGQVGIDKFNPTFTNPAEIKLVNATTNTRIYLQIQ